jgi:hypothetical protein
MSGSHINYRESYFQHPSLTKISGDPTYASLAKLEKECKACCEMSLELPSSILSKTLSE